MSIGLPLSKPRTADRRAAWEEPPTRLGSAAKAVVITVIVAVMTVPFLIVLSTSLASREEITAAGGYVLFPTEPTLQAYRTILSGGLVTRAVTVSVLITGVGTALSLLTTIALAYALSKRGVPGSKPVLLLVLFTLLLAPGMIPMYVLVRELGLLDSYWSLILPGLVNAFNLVVMRAFFMNIPEELYQAARIDGAGDWRILTRIVLPLSKGVIAVVGLFYAVTYWNAFFNAMLYLNDSGKWPVQLLLRTYVVQNKQMAADQLGVAHLPPQQSISMAVVMIALIPILLLYPFLQKYFTKGVLTGAIKG
ncbi:MULTISPECIES: carbohydrate ABC transporter permease [Streptomyces]|jgi:ABC-type glycerol-3-phosphate transport system permease component|uniref:carbohydrate ABC transporter permease n=1 Tax=unclassified Streptomyces TaxID=2593676 RepID=UPI0008851D82|nr:MULTISPECIES: carbohydrate ABC transporter permease [unclassified Streptomyces]MDX2731939.1 carbohydrate ABC transporter permease [Streptomyces sp. PA03-2a]MDX3768825.1 carbohydrate ABC transporter permease [Streptomyces sp. AK08-01B]MDX3815317.1 carbohydrate ABC transporter permease [Streptomyces sp. AK08-01A]SCX89832.1 carbohydrate ABC transporter membrane protein 2, CUT1 family [Streptomyces sp. 136MFCol5.1]SFS44679.1 carbohydrate ABC transporter membrane protein 2, CUT1 family (TC 3.A.1